jgi:CheY-like chemotaxis protein
MTQPAKTILVVDDDPDVLFMTSNFLELEGYNVVEAKDGQEALQILRSRPEINLLFTDIVMPGGLNGFQLAYEARQMRPDLPILYTSGYLKDLGREEPAAAYGRLLAKPWRLENLNTEIRRALA